MCRESSGVRARHGGGQSWEGSRRGSGGQCGVVWGRCGVRGPPGQRGRGAHLGGRGMRGRCGRPPLLSPSPPLLPHRPFSLSVPRLWRGSAPSFAWKACPGWAGSCCAVRGRDGNQMVPRASAPPGRPLAPAAGLGPLAAPGPDVCIVSEKGRISELQLKTPSVSNESPIVFHNVFGRSLPANSFKP